MSEPVSIQANLNILRYVSPTLYYGKYVFSADVMKKNEDGEGFSMVTIDREYPCAYKSKDEIMQVLRRQYNIICKLHPGIIYPSFEECMRYSHSETLDRQEHVIGIYMTMSPRK